MRNSTLILEDSSDSIHQITLTHFYFFWLTPRLANPLHVLTGGERVNCATGILLTLYIKYSVELSS